MFPDFQLVKEYLAVHLSKLFVKRSSRKATMSTDKEVPNLSDAVTRFVQAPGLIRWDLNKNEAVEIMADVGVIPLELTPMDEIVSEEARVRMPKCPEMSWAKENRKRINRKSTVKSNCDFPVLKRCRKSEHTFDYFSHFSDEMILSIFQWLPKETLTQCACVCIRWRTLSYDESLWKRLDLGRKCLPPGILGMIIQRGVIALRLSMAEVESPIFLDPFSSFEDSYSFCRLQYLDMSTAYISKTGLQEIFSVCRQLKKLSLESCYVDEDVCSCMALNTRLEELNMSMCRGLTCASILGISVSCVKLKSWNLAWTGLSSDSVIVLVQSAPTSLTRLNISGLRDTLVDENLLHLVRRCNNLVELDVSDCTCLTGGAIDHIVNHLKNLEHLHISRCYNIDFSKYMFLPCLKNFSKLEIFSVLTDSSLQNLQNLMPEVKINKEIFSTIARPTTGSKRTSIWGLKVRDCS